MKALKPKEQAFVRYFVGGCSGAEAVRRAGWKHKNPKFYAYYLLKKPAVALAVEEEKEAAAATIQVETFQILEEIKRIAHADETDFDIDAKGRLYCVSGDPLATRAVQTFKRTERHLPGGVVKVEYSITMHSKIKALDMLGRLKGMFKEDGEGSDAPSVLVISGIDPQVALGLAQPSAQPSEKAHASPDPASLPQPGVPGGGPGPVGHS